MKKDNLDYLDSKPDKIDKIRVLIDLDGVVRNFVSGLVKVYQNKYPGHKVLPVDSRKLEDFFPIGPEIYQFLEDGNIDEIMKASEPYPYAVEALHRWKNDFEIVIVTSQPDISRAPTYRWIADYDLPSNEVHITFEKANIGGFALLDDFDNNLIDFSQTGRLAVCMDQPWNRHWDGPRVKSVNEFFEYVQRKVYSNQKENTENNLLT